MVFWEQWTRILTAVEIGPEGVDQLVCEGANREFLITVGAIDGAVVLLALLWYWYLNRRLKWTPWVRWLVPIFFGVVIASALVAWNPVRSEALVACLESAEFARFIFLSNVASIPRGLVLGGGGTLGIYVGLFVIRWLVLFLWHLFR
jgi:hypothetical protein